MKIFKCILGNICKLAFPKNLLRFQCRIYCSKMTAKISDLKIRALSQNDPNSYSNPEEVRAERINFVWNLDFENRKVGGSATYNIMTSGSGVRHMIFDIRDLLIRSITDAANGEKIEFLIGESLPEFGAPLTVNLPSLSADNKGSLRIEYECSSEAAALKWLPKEQTLMKTHPYMFAKGFSRSLFPCQDTPSTKASYSAKVTAPKELEVLMSAMKDKDPATVNGNQRVHKFEQKIPIPAYLVTIVAGDIQNKVISPRSRVWAEKDALETAAFDFSETEKMLQVGESLFGEFVWGIYDILVLPPSFPIGGMEYPCLTFVTPSILTGDKSLNGTVMHEICHSWFGNLVTNKTYEHFWLNEGFTVFAERKCSTIMNGEQSSDFSAIGGWKELSSGIKSMGSTNPLTCLVPDLTGVSPADAFSIVPYEKGYAFLKYLEKKVGGSGAFEDFLRHYIVLNRYKSIDTNIFKSQFIGYFTKIGKEESITDVDWNGWLYTPGMPLITPVFDTTLTDRCVALKTRWMNWKTSDPYLFKKEDLKEFTMAQITEFVALLLDEDVPLGKEKVIALQSVYDFHSIKNAELRFRWLTLCMKNAWMEAVPIALQFTAENGRMKLICPIYRQMFQNEEMRPLAIESFLKIRPFMMHQSARAVAKVLHLEC